MFQEVGEALLYLYEVKFVHCDLKPQNLLFGPGDCVSDESSHAGKFWTLANSSLSTTNMGLYNSNMSGKTYIVHST